MWDSWYVSNYFPDLNSVHDILTYDYSKDACSCPTGTQNLSFRLFVWTRFCHVLSTEAGVTNILTFPLCSSTKFCIIGFSGTSWVSNINISDEQPEQSSGKILNFPRLNCKCLSSGISVSIAPSRYSLGAFHVNSMKSVPNKFFFSLTAWCPQDTSFPPRLGGEGGMEPEPNFSGRPLPLRLPWSSWRSTWARVLGVVFVKLVWKPYLLKTTLGWDWYHGISSSATLERADGQKFGPQSHPSWVLTPFRCPLRFDFQ